MRPAPALGPALRVTGGAPWAAAGWCGTVFVHVTHWGGRSGCLQTPLLGVACSPLPGLTSSRPRMHRPGIPARSIPRGSARAGPAPHAAAPPPARRSPRPVPAPSQATPPAVLGPALPGHIPPAGTRAAPAGGGGGAGSAVWGSDSGPERRALGQGARRGPPAGGEGSGTGRRGGSRRSSAGSVPASGPVRPAAAAMWCLHCHSERTQSLLELELDSG